MECEENCPFCKHNKQVCVHMHKFYVIIAIDKDFCEHELPCVQESKVSITNLDGMLSD
jgi:hypothetical protein